MEPLPEPRLSRRATWIAMGAVAVALSLLWVGSDFSRYPDGETEVRFEDENTATKLIGKMAPLDYTVKDMNGIDVRLSTFKGKVIVLNFWATWCPPCKEEIPDLVALQDLYRADIVVLGLSFTDTPQQLREYAAQHGINYPVLVGSGHDEIEDAYGPMWGIPVTVIVDRNGRVARRQSGIRSFEQFEREITRLR